MYMMKIVLPTFSEILNENMQAESKANRRLVEGIKDQVNLSMRTVQRYRLGERVPNLMTAKYILKFLNINIVEDELCEILKYSQKQSKIIKDELSDSSRLIKINVENVDLGIDINPISKNQIISDRINELFGKKGTLTKYIEELIQKDLNDRIL